MQKNILIPISEAAGLLGVSIDTLRRWDKKGSLRAIRTPGGHRLYRKEDLQSYTEDMFNLAKNWATLDREPAALDREWHCENSLVFQTKLARMEKEFIQTFSELDWVSLIVAATGEIGNNSFDHNLGNWRDVSGVFFGYDKNKRQVVLADRGQGVFTTLSRVKPDLKSDADALHTAFTEVISGRAPEARGNGLKLVRTITEQYPMTVDFYSGEAHVVLRNGKKMNITDSGFTVLGSLTLITF